MVEVLVTVEIEGKYYLRVLLLQCRKFCTNYISKLCFRQFEIWHQLGTVEIEDQIAVTQYLIKNLAIIDPKKVSNPSLIVYDRVLIIL